MTAPRILLVEDDATLAQVMVYNLTEEGWQVQLATRGDDAEKALKAAQRSGRPFDVLVTDVKLPGLTGDALLRQVVAEGLPTAVVLVTAFGTVEDALQAMSEGAADYITKPFRRAELKARVRKAIEAAALRRENATLRDRARAAGEAGAAGEGPRVLTQSPKMKGVMDVVARVATADVPVLITGESGTGKELVARALHSGSHRAAAPFVALNCAALPRELLESELFGHERGAFTGAAGRRVGRFEQAHGGTLFLDELGELPLDLQAKLLRVLEDGQVNRLGAERPVAVDVRVLAATNRDLRAEVEAQRFRGDLYHRLGVVPIALPPLRERAEDIPLLVAQRLSELGLSGQVRVSEALCEALRRMPWPGNVRELRNTVQRMALLRRTDTLDLADLAAPGQPAPHVPPPAPTAPRALRPGHIELPDAPFSLPALEREIIEKALARHGGNQSATARYLGVPRHVLLYRLEKFAQEERGG